MVVRVLAEGQTPWLWWGGLGLGAVAAWAWWFSARQVPGQVQAEALLGRENQMGGLLMAGAVSGAEDLSLIHI